MVSTSVIVKTNTRAALFNQLIKTRAATSRPPDYPQDFLLFRLSLSLSCQDVELRSTTYHTHTHTPIFLFLLLFLSLSLNNKIPPAVSTCTGVEVPHTGSCWSSSRSSISRNWDFGRRKKLKNRRSNFGNSFDYRHRTQRGLVLICWLLLIQGIDYHYYYYHFPLAFLFLLDYSNKENRKDRLLTSCSVRIRRRACIAVTLRLFPSTPPPPAPWLSENVKLKGLETRNRKIRKTNLKRKEKKR